jgi:hypothetical protein
MFSISTPAEVHHHFSHLNLACIDCSFGNMLTRANTETDPIEKMKLVSTYLIASHYICPTIIEASVPLNPILGETCQRELETGEKFVAE